jgi:branched-chain amino acid transport system substrate-binding protein
MKRSFLFLLFFVMMAGFVLTSGAQQNPKVEGFTYRDKIGVVKIKPEEPIHIAAWMVVEGPDAFLGIDTKRGVEIAVDDKGGKLLGHPIKLSVQDTGCNAEGGQLAATILASDPTIVAALGSNCSNEARSGVPILWKAGIVTISPSNNAPDLTDPDRSSEYSGYLRTSLNDKLQGAVAAAFAFKRLEIKRAATIQDGSIYADQLQKIFAQTFKKMGGLITSQEAVSPIDTDIRPLLTEIATGKPEFIYYPTLIEAGIHITRQSRQIKGLEKVYLMSSDGIFSKDFYKAVGEAAIGMYQTSPDLSPFPGRYKVFLTKYRKKYGEKPLAFFHAHAYDAAMILFAAIEKVAQRAPDGTLYIGRQKLRDALYATKNFKGLTGNITCDRYGDCADPKIAVYRTTSENIKKLEMPDKPFWTPTPAKKVPAKKK